jgi:hypothetical protein
MRIVTCCAVLAFLLLGPVTPRVLASQRSAHGNVDFTIGDGITRSLHFKAKFDNHGNPDGDMTFTDPAAPAAIDPDNSDGSEGPTTRLTVQVVFDCLVVDDTHAVMGGTIVDSTVPDTPGQRFLLTVEDNGEGSHAPPDRLAWGVYADTRATWLATDAELEEDTGAGTSWFATDAEREDDTPIPVSAGNPSQAVTCTSFPVSAYALVPVDGHGNIQVNP